MDANFSLGQSPSTDSCYGSGGEQGFSEGQLRLESVCSKLGSASYQSNGWLDSFNLQVFGREIKTNIRFQVEGILAANSSWEEAFEVNGKCYSYQVQ